MIEEKHILKRKVHHFWIWKWIALLLALLLLLCLFFNCCNRIHPAVTEQIPNSDNVGIQQPITGAPRFPDQPGRLTPIDTNLIVISPDDPLKREIVEDRLNIYLKDSTDARQFVANLAASRPQDSIEVTYYAEVYSRVQLHVVPANRQELKEILKNGYPGVKYAVDEWIMRKPSRTKPSDPGFSIPAQSWFYETIGLYNAWGKGFGDSTLVVAVIDDGFDLSHVELKGQFLNQWNVADYSEQVNSGGTAIQHGTHVAGSISANRNNGTGISGVAPGCRLMPIQISDASGIITQTAILDGIFYALKNHADVINLSLALSLPGISHQMSRKEQQDFSDSQLLDEALLWDEVFKIASDDQCIIVQAAGNDAILAAVDPMKRSENCIVVGAMDADFKAASFSNAGNSVTIFAPGVGIFSALPGNKIGPMDGTSMASPIVAGCVALMLSRKRGLSQQKIKEIIVSSGRKLPGEQGTIIQIDKALNMIQ